MLGVQGIAGANIRAKIAVTESMSLSPLRVAHLISVFVDFMYIGSFLEYEFSSFPFCCFILRG